MSAGITKMHGGKLKERILPSIKMWCTKLSDIWIVSPENIIWPKCAFTCCLKWSFISFTFIQAVLLSRLGKHFNCQRRIKNKAETGGLHFHVKVSNGRNVNQCVWSKSFIGTAFFSGFVLGAACYATGSSVVDHCCQCLLSIKSIPTGRTVYKASRSQQVL